MGLSASMIIVMLYTAAEGIYMLVAKRPLFRGTDKYTEESLREYSSHAWILSIICAILIGAESWVFYNKGFSMLTLIVLVAVVIFIIVSVMMRKKYLVRK